MTDLSAKMRRLADSGHPRSAELREMASAFDEAAQGFYADPQTVDVMSFIGAWARARRLWSATSGEPLI